MLDDVIQSIVQMFDPPLRAVLWKSIGLALAQSSSSASRSIGRSCT